MNRVKLLLLEDMTTDADLVKLVLKRSGLDFQATVVQNRQEFVSALEEGKFDAILADNSLPQFSATEALEIMNSKKMSIPFILVTGSISEEYAVTMMREGATDYILKDRLQRLPNALLNALDKHRVESERKKYLEEIIANEALLNEAARLANFGSWEMDVVNNTQRWSDEQYRILGYLPGEIAPAIDNFLSRVHPEEIASVEQSLTKAMRSTSKQNFDCRIITKDGSIKHIYSEMAAMLDENGNLLRINGFIKDISDVRDAVVKEKKITADLMQRNKELEQFAYIISHNLRGPVANIAGLSEAMMDRDISDDDKQECVEAIHKSIRKLDDIIIDLNDLIQVKNNINENKQEVVFSRIVEEVRSFIGKPLDDNDVIIKTDFAAVSGMLTLKSYLHSIFYNLISNSIKFRKRDLTPIIEIKSGKIKECIEITFKDNSIGIDLENKSNHVFGLYKRFHPNHAEGKGMGLFLVKTQVEALGGKINVFSKVNEGTEFKIEFEPQFITS